MDAQCTTDCPGESCESITNIQGVCYASNVDSLASCDLYGSDNSVVTVWYQDALCILDPVSSEESCSQVLIIQQSDFIFVFIRKKLLEKKLY